MTPVWSRVLVTGGAGYIGSVLVPLLLDRGHHVRVLDSLRWGGESLLGPLNSQRFELLRGDIRDAAAREAAVAGVNSVVHLAAIVGDPACRAEPELSKEVNLDASLELFEASVRHKLRRFVSVSTCSNYGQMGDPLTACDENAELRPVSLYARLKVAFEQYLLQSTAPICVTSLRFATAYGLSPRMRFDLTVNEFARDAAAGRDLVVFGEDTWRPYCHTVDLARACLHVLEAGTTSVDRQVFNVGSDDENYQKRMLVDEIQKACPSLVYRFVPQGDDPRNYRVSFQKIGRLGFAVSRRVPDGIREIHRVVRSGVIRDPFLPKYSNTQPA